MEMLTEFKPVIQVAARVAEDHDVSVDAFAEKLKAVSGESQRNHPV